MRWHCRPYRCCWPEARVIWERPWPRACCLLGAVGTPEVPPGVIERGLLLKMRFELDLFVNQRPFVDTAKGIDFIVIRENTEGTYAGEGGFLRKGTPLEVATQGSVNTRFGAERCIRYAFEKANHTERKTLHLIHKKNVLTFAGDLWQRVFDEVAEEYPSVTVGYDHIDALISKLKAYLDAAGSFTGSIDDPAIRERLTRAWVGLRAMRSYALATMDVEKPGQDNISKLLWANWHRDLGELAMDVMGKDSLTLEGDFNEWQRLFLFSRADTIYGGSNEIQRNVLAERVLGLPREVKG